MTKPAPNVNDVKIQHLLGALNTGHYMDRACKLSSISRATVYNWIDFGKQAELKLNAGKPLTEREQQYFDIYDAISKAREAAAHRALLTIQQAAQAGTWQAAAWYLERTDREHYGRVTQVSGPDNGPIDVRLSRDDLTNEIMRILEGGEGDESQDDSAGADPGTEA